MHANPGFYLRPGLYWKFYGRVCCCLQRHSGAAQILSVGNKLRPAR